MIVRVYLYIETCRSGSCVYYDEGINSLIHIVIVYKRVRLKDNILLVRIIYIGRITTKTKRKRLWMRWCEVRVTQVMTPICIIRNLFPWAQWSFVKSFEGNSSLTLYRNFYLENKISLPYIDE